MRFAYEEVRLFLLAIPLLVIVFALAARRRDRTLARLGDERLVALLARRSPRIWRVTRRGCLLGAVGFLTLAAARPQAALDWINVEQSGIDLVIALDISQSMSARDIKPSRLERAKQDVRDLLGKLEGDRAALVVFSGEAAVQSPLTVDHGAIRLLLDVVEPGLLPTPGTAIEAALVKAAGCFDEDDDSQARAILLITDGESHEGNVDRAIDVLDDAGIRVFALGIGRPEGEPIPVTDEGGGVSYKSDREGRVVMTRLDESTLQKIALETGGAYVPVTGGTEGVDHVARLIADMEERAFEAGMYKLYEDRFLAFLIPGMVLLALEFFVGDLVKRYRT